MTHTHQQEFAKPGVDTQFQAQTTDFSSSLQPKDFEHLNKTMLQSNGKADEALKEKGTLPELKLVAEQSNKSPEEILKYGKTAATELHKNAVDLLHRATGVFSPEAHTANKIDKLAKDVSDGSGWFSDHRERKNLNDRTNEAADKKALSELTPAERKQYEAEKQQQERWEFAQKTRMMIKMGDDPAPPSPMMDRVNNRAHEIKREAREDVMKGLSPEERKQLNREEDEFAKKVREYWQNDSPYDATIYRPALPKLGPMQREIEERVARRIEMGR